MRNIINTVALVCLASFVFGQKIKDSITISIDTINIKGKVVNELGKPINDISILSETHDSQYNILRTKTDRKGLFKLNGVKPTDVIKIRNNETVVEYNLMGSRYLHIVLTPFNKLKLNTTEAEFNIKAKRVSPKEKYTYKNIDTVLYGVMHPFGYQKLASYPGGNKKLYELIKKTTIYPDNAINNNIEGLVAIEFTIDIKGNYKDFLVVRDIGYGCSEEVIKAIKKSKRWEPSTNGIPVNQRVLIEVPFKLDD